MRLLVLILSLGSVVAYGRALGEFGGYLLGKGNLSIALGALLGGTVAGLGALGLWRRHLVPKKNGSSPLGKNLPRN